MKTLLSNSIALCTLALACAAGAQDIKKDLQQKVATVKDSVAKNQAALRQYSWTEHTDISLKGEVKKTKDSLCRYGPDGKVAKTPIGTPEEEKKKHGIRGRVAEKKIGELEDYMERAAALIHNYVPPSPTKMQEVHQAGNAGLAQAGPGKIELQFRNYVKPGDSVTFSFDTAAKALLAMQVNSYLDDPKDDIVTLSVVFDKLPDGTGHVAGTTLNAEAKKVMVKTTNTNYQKLAK